MSKRAPRVTRVPVAMPAQGATTNWLRGIRLSGFTMLTLGMLIVFVVALAPSLRVFAEQQNERAQLAAEVAAQQELVEELEQDVARWDDPSYVEAQARERLYYVKPGEYSYLIIDDGQTVTNDAGLPISDEVLTTEVDWVSTMLSSVFTAGLTDATPAEIVAPSMQEVGQ
ncbi:septum formation initiator family protein [Salinibacterium sp. SYSU T00001]|uniref:FtsB family cell division protein n=1 Tax=Homoserinimonas sedimenticola TaxID=2986805 RepID=UPI002235D56A|nr:septum formation initiator family protein [Salinibacterium sedimenticola]MCW4386425.1 septum formation initiator family protein [Salinibacterium sedimenticola]